MKLLSHTYTLHMWYIQTREQIFLLLQCTFLLHVCVYDRTSTHMYSSIRSTCVHMTYIYMYTHQLYSQFFNHYLKYNIVCIFGTMVLPYKQFYTLNLYLYLYLGTKIEYIHTHIPSKVLKKRTHTFPFPITFFHVPSTPLKLDNSFLNLPCHV